MDSAQLFRALACTGDKSSWINGPLLAKKSEETRKKEQKAKQIQQIQRLVFIFSLHFSSICPVPSLWTKSLKFLSGHITTTIIIILTLNSSGSQRLRKACCPGWSIPQWWALTANICKRVSQKRGVDTFTNHVHNLLINRMLGIFGCFIIDHNSLLFHPSVADHIVSVVPGETSKD